MDKKAIALGSFEGVNIRPYNSNIPIDPGSIKAMKEVERHALSSLWIVDLYDGDSVICVEI